MTEHPLADILRAVADGRAVQYKSLGWGWRDYDETSAGPTPLTYQREYKWRIKPEPRKPREFWINIYDNEFDDYAYLTKEAADKAAAAYRLECIHVREVLEDEI